MAITIPSTMLSRTARARTTDSSSSWVRPTSLTKVETLARSTPASTGAKTKSTAPLAYAVAVSSSSLPNAVRKMIGVSSEPVCSRMSLATS